MAIIRCLSFATLLSRYHFVYVNADQVFVHASNHQEPRASLGANLDEHEQMMEHDDQVDKPDASYAMELDHTMDGHGSPSNLFTAVAGFARGKRKASDDAVTLSSPPRNLLKHAKPSREAPVHQYSHQSDHHIDVKLFAVARPYGLLDPLSHEELQAEFTKAGWQKDRTFKRGSMISVYEQLMQYTPVPQDGTPYIFGFDGNAEVAPVRPHTVFLPGVADGATDCAEQKYRGMWTYGGEDDRVVHFVAKSDVSSSGKSLFISIGVAQSIYAVAQEEFGWVRKAAIPPGVIGAMRKAKDALVGESSIESANELAAENGLGGFLTQNFFQFSSPQVGDTVRLLDAEHLATFPQFASPNPDFLAGKYGGQVGQIDDINDSVHPTTYQIRMDDLPDGTLASDGQALILPLEAFEWDGPGWGLHPSLVAVDAIRHVTGGKLHFVHDGSESHQIMFLIWRKDLMQKSDSRLSREAAGLSSQNSDPGLSREAAGLRLNINLVKRALHVDTHQTGKLQMHDPHASAQAMADKVLKSQLKITPPIDSPRLQKIKKTLSGEVHPVDSLAEEDAITTP